MSKNHRLSGGAALLFSSLFWLCPGQGAAAPPRRRAGTEPTDRIIVKFRDQSRMRAASLSAASLAPLNARAGVALAHHRRMSGDAQVLRLPSRMPLEQVEAVLDKIRRDPSVEYADPVRRRVPQLNPNDTQYGSQWHYTAPASNAGGANLPTAWDITTGSSSVVVAVLDTGWLNHADLAGRSVGGYCFIRDSTMANNASCTPGQAVSDPSDTGDFITLGDIAYFQSTYGWNSCGCGQYGDQPCNSSWHGTHVSGTIGAASNNGAGVAGVNWVSKILPVRVLGKCGGTDDDIIDGIRWAAGLAVSGLPTNPNPAKVINMSLGGAGACPASWQSAIDDAVNAGATVVVAAGNDWTNMDGTPYTPGSCSNVVSVAAVEPAGSLAWYSNFGSAVALSAPGGQTCYDWDVDGNCIDSRPTSGVLSTGDSGTQGPSNDNVYTYKQGTSMAAPHVAGVASLMVSTNTSLTPSQVRSMLRSTARSFPDSTCNTGICGAGLLDASAAVREALRPSDLPSNITAATQGTSSITWTWGSVPRALYYNVYFGTNPTQLAGSTFGSATNQAFTLNFPSNTLTNVIVKAVNTGGEGPGGASPSTTTLAAPLTSVNSADAHITSITVTWTPCLVNACAGYVLQASPNADFSPPLFSSVTFSYTVGRLQVFGLSKLTDYYLRLATLNWSSGPSFYRLPGTVQTLTDLVPPGLGAPPFSNIAEQAIRFNWTSSGNPSPVTYQADVSSMPGYIPLSGSQSGSELFTALFSGLLPNTSYYFKVRVLGGGATTYAGPTATLAAAPAAAAAPFLAVYVSSLTMAWAANGNAPDTLYQAELSSDAFSHIAVSSLTRNTYAAFPPALDSNTAYSARVFALNRTGGASAPYVLGSTLTLVQSPGGPYSFSGLGSSGFAFSFTGNNPYPTQYVVRACLSPSCSSVAASSSTLAESAAFSGLLSNATYYVSAAALNGAGTPTLYTAAQATATLAVAPAALASPVTNRSSATLGFSWSAGTLSPGTTYLAEVSSSASFAWAVQSSATMNTRALFTGLQPNTPYYGRVRALSVSQAPDGPTLDAGGFAATLPLPPPAAAFQSVFFTSATAVWQALPLSPSSAACQGYRLELSASPGFTGTVYSSAVAPGVSTATLTGLGYATVYYARLASLNAEGQGNYISLASTATAAPPFSSGTVSGSAGLTLLLPPAFPELSTVTLTVPVGAFPAGTSISAVAQMTTDLTAARSNQVAGMTPFGANVGLELSAGGLQPAVPVLLSLDYDPARVPLGQDPKTLRLFTYDAAGGQWTMLLSQVDVRARKLTALLYHFSLFAPFFVTAGTDLSAVQAFPQPWEIGDAASPYWAAALQFTNMPADATVKIFTVTGELVVEEAAAGGVFAWNGSNRFGRKAASGTYLVVVSAGGGTMVRRVVLIR
ncbi:MAG: S8 family serine peptidase [Elusimicrobia bacterium]|nr:S8 family serine peptidase [Elusimicrobiota bacterium]